MDQNDIDTKIGKDKHYVIEFFAKKCYWCQIMAPEYDRLAQYYNSENSSEHDVIISRVDALENMILGYKFQITSYPTIVLVRKGENDKAFVFESEKTFENLKGWIDDMISPEEISSIQQSNDNSDCQILDESEKNGVLGVESSGNYQKGSLELNQYLSSLSQKNSYESDISFIKDKLMEKSNRTSTSELFDNFLFFIFGFLSACVLFITYKFFAAINHLKKVM